MMAKINLDAYFKRIGYEGTPTTSLDTLHALHEKHTEAIPFENLNPLLGLPVKLDAESLEQKMIHSRRGGYCFEQNLLFKHILEVLGFKVKGLAARIRWNNTGDEITPRGHMLLLVQVDEDYYIADVGFGGLTLTAPLRLETDIVQETPHEPYRLLREDEGFVMQALVREEWKPIYYFDLQQQYLPDYEVSSWYLSNHPESHFVRGLIAARPARGKRYALHNNKLSIHHLNGETEKRRLESASELREVLERNFLLTLPKVPEHDKSLQQLIEPEKKMVS